MGKIVRLKIILTISLYELPSWFGHLAMLRLQKKTCNNAWFAVVMPKVSIWNMIDAFFHRKPGQQYTLYNF